MHQLPNKFRSMIRDLWGDHEAVALKAALSDASPVSIRLNPLKPSHHFENLEPIPWCPKGFYLPSRISFTLDPYFHGGHYYVQEASSMWLDQAVLSLELPMEAKILDLCAAPGGKTTLIAGVLGTESLIHAHETQSSRAETLRQNLVKWGYPNFLVSTGPIQKLPASGILYDLVVVDAPCSGEGMFRKEPEAIAQWNDHKVNKCHFMQRDILQIATQLVRPGGYLIYSTCTFNSKENEESLSTILSGGNFQSLHLPHHPNIESLIESNNGSCIVYRCLPNRIKGEGYSFSVLKNTNKEDQNLTYRKNNGFKEKSKRDSLSMLERYIQNPASYRIAEYESGFCALREPWAEAYQSCRNAKIQLLHAGIPMGSFKGTDWIPNHALALSTELNPNIGRVSMDHAQSLDYLRALDPKEIPPQAQDQNKWFLANFESVNLGWFKLNGNKFKNYLPKDLRIRNL